MKRVFCNSLFIGSIIVFVALSDAHAGKLLKQGNGYSVWYENPIEKVYQNDPIPTQQINTVTIKSARNEYEPFQVIIRPDSSWKDVSLEFSALTGAGNIPHTNFAYFRVDYVNITQTSYDLSIGRLGWTPDPLLPESASDLEGGQNNPFWVHIYIPKEAAPGIYTGTIYIKKEGTLVERISLQLEVWDFMIPIERNLTVYGNSPKSSEFVSQRRISSNFAEMWASVDKNTGDVNIYTSEFDKAASYYIDELGNNAFEYPCTGWVSHGGTHHWPSGATWNGIPYFIDEDDNILNPQFVDLYGQMIRKTSQYLKSKGWLKYAFVYFVDEIYGSDSIEKVAKVFELIKSIDPDIRTAWVSGSVPDRLKECTSLWIVHEDFYDPVVHQERKMAGDEVWVYNNSQTIIDYHYMRVRSFPWHLWNFQLDGTEFWSMTRWIDGDPWENPYNFDRNGNGFLLYPAGDLSEEPVISSIRLELLREGIEDYEYLHMLKELIELAKLNAANLDDIEAAEQALARSMEISMDRARSNPPNDEPYSKDTSLLYKVKEQIASAILSLRGAGILKPQAPPNLRFSP